MSGQLILSWKQQGTGRYELYAYPDAPKALVVLYSVSTTGKYRVKETWVGREFRAGVGEESA